MSFERVSDDFGGFAVKRVEKVAWSRRRLDLCHCDHNEFCEYCWPTEFRPGGKYTKRDPVDDASLAAYELYERFVR
jgi:hypothetical protein